MTIEEAVDLLTVAASFDRRTIGRADAIAWHAVLGDLSYADARDAVLGHYGATREWIMPADIRTRVQAVRTERIRHAQIPAPPPELADDPAAYKAALAESVRLAADGQLPPAETPLAITGGTPEPGRRNGPPASLAQTLTELRAGLQARRKAVPDPQQLAAEQVAEARTERDEQDREAS